MMARPMTAITQWWNLCVIPKSILLMTPVRYPAKVMNMRERLSGIMLRIGCLFCREGCFILMDGGIFLWIYGFFDVADCFINFFISGFFHVFCWLFLATPCFLGICENGGHVNDMFFHMNLPFICPYFFGGKCKESPFMWGWAVQSIVVTFRGVKVTG